MNQLKPYHDNRSMQAPFRSGAYLPLTMKCKAEGGKQPKAVSDNWDHNEQTVDRKNIPLDEWDYGGTSTPRSGDSRILGSLVQQGSVAKLPDDLYCGGDTPEDALGAWKSVLQALSDNNLHLSATKTTICPQFTIILGWVWRQGTLQASPHCVSALSICKLDICK